ncbi:uncharacterized protein LOC114944334 [Nylanderia fulva]|uniref:uncharacterized protein LOC114944334 n=1 Tax=Nylanderia fulva TaxID=613905 RepID=UPI0010FB2AFC|nr:uncharacterized protein LOC114944334 [Nylanderia fulva]
MKVVVLIACMLALVAGEICSINGTIFRQWMEEYKKGPPIMPEEDEMFNQLYYAADKGGLIDKDKKMINLSKTLQFCVCLVSDQENRNKCNINTYFCDAKVAEVIKHAISLKNPM